MLLNERRRDREKDHNGNDNGGARVAQKERDRGQGDEERVEGVSCPAPELLKDRRRLLAGHQIEAIGLQA